jgi:glycosyltransferase involved in cell wall biosynthesis
MRVALVTDTHHPGVNGVVRSVDVSRAALARAGAAVRVLAPGDRATRRAPTDASLRHVPAFETNAYPGLRLAVRPVLPRDLRDAEAVHVHTPGPLGASAIAAARRAGARRLVYTYHTRFDEAIPLFAPRGLRTALNVGQGKLHEWIFRTADDVVAPSPAIAAELRARHGVEAHVVPTGLDPAFEATAARARASARGRRRAPARASPRLLYLGRLAPEKRIELLLDGFARVLRERPGARLALAGEGPSRAPLARHAKALGIERAVEWLGFVPEDRLAATYASADVFVTPSTYETQGITVLEALACGAPVAVPDLPVFDLLGGSVERFASGDAESLAAAIRRALDPDEERALVAESVVQHASARAMAERLLAVYRGEKPAPFEAGAEIVLA